MALLQKVHYLLPLILYIQVLQVKSESGLVVFLFPKMVFMEFYDKMLDSRQNLANHGGVIEVLTYKLFQVGLVPGWRQEFCLSVVSFKDLSKAYSWSQTDPVITDIQKWSHDSEIMVLLTKSNYNRGVPLTRNYGAHVLAIFQGVRNETAFQTELQPHLRDVFIHHGGTGYAEATKWKYIVRRKTSIPAESTWLFYAPMPKIENAIALLNSSNINSFVKKYASDMDYLGMFAAHSFFNAAILVSFNFWTLLLNILVVYTVYCNMSSVL